MSTKKKIPSLKAGEHHVVASLLRERITVALVGAGGNGSQMLSGLARLHMALLKLGHPGGLHVSVFDPDFVSESNVGRQLFYPGDIGTPKAFALINRLNLAWGFDWHALCEMFDPDMVNSRGYESTPFYDVVISCVDTAKSRRQIHKLIFDKGSRTPAYWLDLGNRQRDGQVILGQPQGSIRYASTMANIDAFQARKALDQIRLPCVTDVFPDLLDPGFKEENTPSCSLAEALQKQDLFINQAISTFALQLLWRLLREGKINHHGAFINLETGRVNALSVPKNS